MRSAVVPVLVLLALAALGCQAGGSGCTEDAPMDMEMSGPVQTTSTDPPAPSTATVAIESSPVDGFIEFALGDSSDDWALAELADQVYLGLGGEPLVRRSREALKRREAWELDKKLWRGGVGPFSAIEILRKHRGDVTVTKGPHMRCDQQPIAVPRALRRYEQWSVQPAAPESCIAWFAVDVWVNRFGQIVGVTLDEREP